MALPKGPGHWIEWFSLALLLIPATACSPPPTQVSILHPDSLSPLIEELSARFEENNPSIRIAARPAQGWQDYRELGKQPEPYDLIAVVDLRLFSRLEGSGLEEKHSFLANEIVLASYPGGPLDEPGARQAWERGWIDRLFQPGRRYGRVDPQQSPDGYWVELSWKLAELYYRRSGLYSRLLNHLSDGASLPRLDDLVENLNGRKLDFAFLYRSTALQNSLPFISLPPQVALGDRAYDSFFAQVFVRIKNPQGQDFELTGAPIRYGLARRRQSSPQADRFLQYLLSEESQALVREMGYLPGN